MHDEYLDQDNWEPDSQDVAEMLWKDRKARDGWTSCDHCGDMMHRDDYAEGATCSCDQDE